MIRAAIVFLLGALVATAAVANPSKLLPVAIIGLSFISPMLGIVASVVGSFLAASKARRKARDAFNASLRDRMITVRGSTEPRRVVLGRQRVGGVVAYIASTGANKEKLVMVIALAAHEIDAVEQVFFNDEPVTIVSEQVTSAPYGRSDKVVKGEAKFGDGVTTTFAIGFVPIAGTVFASQEILGDNPISETFVVTQVVGQNVTLATAPTGSFQITYQINQITSYARVRAFLGAPGQTVDTVVQGLIPAWDASHTMTGVAGLVVILDYNEDVFQTEVEVSAVIRGATVYDPRKDSTNGGSGPHRLTDPNTWEWSETPPLLIANAAMNPVLGRQPSTAVNWTDVAAAANVCDQQVDYGVGAGVSIESLYTAGITATSSQRPIDVISELAEAMAGSVAFVGNQLRMRAGEFVAPVISLNDDSFAGSSVSIQVRPPREQIFNVITGKIIDAAQGWKSDVDFPRVIASEFVTADGGVELPIDVQFDAVTRSPQAQQLAAVMLRRARQSLTVVATFNLSAFATELFDVVSLTSSRYGWSGKAFEVIGRKWTLEGLIELTLRETDASVYAFGTTFDAIDSSPNTNLPLPSQVELLTGLFAQSGTAALSDGSIVTRTQLSWTPSTDQSVIQNGKVEIQYRLADQALIAGDWPATFEQGGASQTVITGLQGSRAYAFRARFIGLGGRVRGQWSLMIVHVIAGEAVLWENVQGAPKQFRVVAEGFDAVTAGTAPLPSGLYDGSTGDLLLGVSRSYIVNVIRRSDGAVIQPPNGIQIYDVFDPSPDEAGAPEMAAMLNSLSSDVIVVVHSFDEPQTNRLSAGLDAAMYRCGASRAVFGSPQFKNRSAYILIGIPGSGEGNGAEAYQGSIDNDPNAWTEMSFMVTSAGALIVTGAATPRTLADYSYVGDLDATNGATLGVNVGGQITASNQATLMADGAVSANVSANQSTGVVSMPNSAANFVLPLNLGSINSSGGWIKFIAQHSARVHVESSAVVSVQIKADYKINGVTPPSWNFVRVFGPNAFFSDPTGPGRAIELDLSFSDLTKLTGVQDYSADFTVQCYNSSGLQITPGPTLGKSFTQIVGRSSLQEIKT